MAFLHSEQLLINTQTRTLTTSVEAIVGSAGDDTITAAVKDAVTGAAITTINSGDSIDGGLGNDTLTLNLAQANNNSLSGLTIKGVENIVYVGLNNTGSGAAAVATATTNAATAAATLAAAVAGKTAADANKVATAAALATSITKNGTVVASAAKVAGITALKTAIAAEADDASLETDIAALTATAVTNTFISADEKTAIDAAIGITATNAVVTPLITAATAKNAAVVAATAADTAAGLTKDAYAAADVTDILPAAYLADSNAKAALVAAKAALGAVSLAANAEATSITIDGTTSTVTGLKDTQTLTIKASSVADTASYAATATVANIALSSATGTITIGDGGATDVTTAAKALATAKVTGSVKATLPDDASGVTVAGTITLVDAITGTSALKTLTLGLTSDAKVTATGMAAVKTIDGSTSTGGIALGTSSASTIGTGVMNITTGAGKDTVYFNPATTATTTATLTASLNTGAGNDSIVVNHTGTGTAAVNAGAGDDSVTFTSGLGTATIDGGDGKDTITVTNTAFSTGGYNNLKSSVTNFEVLAFSGTAAVDAVKAGQFSEFTFKKTATLDANNFVSKVADAQVINTTANDVVINAAGYVAKGSTDADGVTALSTTYAGAITVNAKGGTATTDAAATDVIVNASSVTLNVSVNPTSGSLANTASYVALSGDVKTATVNVNKGVNNTGLPTSEIASTVEITTGTGVNSTSKTDDVYNELGVSTSSVTLANTALKALGNLSSLTLTGTGVALVNNASGTKLVSVDASGMNGTVTFGATAGAAAAGLTWTSGVSAEAVKLGSTLDTLTIAPANSTYAKMDSITGFSLVANVAGDLVTTKSDDLTVTDKTFLKVSTAFSGSLDAALTAVAAKLGTVGTTAEKAAYYDNVVFQCGGNTYIFAESATQSLTVDDADTVIELVGLVDLDLLTAALNS